MPCDCLDRVRHDTHGARSRCLQDTADCWECCTNGRDTVQVADASGMTWVNATIALSPTDNSTLLVTPVGPTPAGTVTQLRYAAPLWPQCTVYAVGNAFPAAPFIINVTTAVAAPPAPLAASRGARPVAAKRVLSLPLAQRGPATWTEWKGRAVPTASDSGLVPTPPMGFNT